MNGNGQHPPVLPRPLVYVAGPITGDPFGCVREALPAFRFLLDLGCVPFMPQFSIIAEIVESIPYETWMAYDFDVIRHAAALVRLPGESPGADREVVLAGRLGIPVFAWPEARSLIAAWRAHDGKAHQ